MRLFPGSRNYRSLNITAILLALIPSLIKLLYYPHNIGSDDAYIHLQIARNVLSGHGWGLNAEMPVNMSSSPAFTLLLIFISTLTVHAIPAMQILSCLASTSGLLFIYWTVHSETGSENIGLISEASAALSLGESLGVSMARPSAIERANEITQAKASPQQDLGQVLKQDIKAPIQAQEIGLEMGLGL
jgi:hypothetical protein